MMLLANRSGRRLGQSTKAGRYASGKLGHISSASNSLVYDYAVLPVLLKASPNFEHVNSGIKTVMILPL